MDLLELQKAFSTWDKDAVEGRLLNHKVAEFLRQLIMDGHLPPESQLPNEPDLSAYLDISRSTVRSALSTLEQSGFINRIWGVGTFVAKDPPTYNNLNLNSGVTQLIRSAGLEPGTSEILITTRPASERICSHLLLEADAPTLVIERVRLADEKRVVFTVDVIPLKLFDLPNGQTLIDELEAYVRNQQSIYEFFRLHMNLAIHHGIAWIRPLSAEQYIADRLQLREGSNLLHLEQVDYDNNGEPVAFSDEYYVADAFRFQIFRSNQVQR
ncbi:MAG: GntR family transcriptional regulator [Clostridiaceae bacterium]|jgi:GntR family transcriptional regulator|nr:GntR family transcriptional regulator [Clostridiaceae bacterium]